MNTAEKPLSGKRILVTRVEEGAQDLARKLLALGAEPVILPMITFHPPDDWAPVDREIEQLERYNWVIFTSANGVRFFLERLRQLGYPPQRLQRAKIAAVGPATARALTQQGLSVDVVPARRYLAESIAEELGDLQGQQILLPQADIARQDLKRLLRDKGARVLEVVAYRTLRANLQPKQVRQIFQKGLEIVTFTSASAVQALAVLVERALLQKVTIACIGPVTARAVEAAGWQAQIIAQEHTIDGLISAIIKGVNDHLRT
ncbi:uroporphyrinogen-III synthase [Candidatus Acetothermia bacterium]|jgi:uroporphyrinogen III methyltransferase/synthase|nr:uroporphyrinogen-III synthase [Candidatus Acetothermia bacterium]MCI2431168.1 uroporphyrinogen-III synthase [Candidatus Acetothermia bacterium]MCI2436058.1 uroporphyrinogen-III synthase [Candidatus Acetothermia bacterium]